MPSAHSKKILLVPLDWGLGHTTRCIPIIRTLINLGHEIEIGGTNVTNSILKQEFPNLIFHTYPSYRITYPRNAKRFIGHMFKMVPFIAQVVKQEKKITDRLCSENSFDIVISDNRFGVRSKRAKNFFISHQLNLSVPSSRLAQWLVNKVNKYYINQFDQVMVPDLSSQVLSGKLSDTDGVKPPIRHLGCISRWRTSKINKNPTHKLLAILSGPEPQRTMLEDLLIDQANKLKTLITIVRAKPTSDKVPHDSEYVRFYNHLSALELKQMVLDHEVIISRAGYTTILDLASIGKHAILIPTPGQTEQEYLAKHLESQALFLFYNQAEFELNKALLDYSCNQWGQFPEFENYLEEQLKSLLIS